MKLAIYLLALAAALLITAGCTPPRPIDVVFILDSSASFTKFRQSAIRTVRKITESLNPDDRVSIYRLDDAVYNIYSGPPIMRRLKQALETYSQVKPGESGTAYGAAINRGLEDIQQASIPQAALIILGDGADELCKGGGNIDWKTLPLAFHSFPASASLAFLYTPPKFGDRYRQALAPVLGDKRLLILAPEFSRNGMAARKIERLLAQ